MTEQTAFSTTGIAGPVRAEAVKKNAALEPFADDSNPPIRRELYDGQMHTVVPSVLAIDGVMAGSGGAALVTGDVLAKHVAAWNGRPVVLLHPEDQAGPVSAAADPRILERSVGTVFSARVEDGKLKADLWLNEPKMDALSASDVLAAIVGGEIVEVSTGYFSDDIIEHGEYNGREYDVRHVNLKPDHLALLPGQIGACSVADGCGVPRINAESRSMKTSVKDSISVIMSALGFKANCVCEETAMKVDDLKKFAGELKANGAITAKQLKMLEEMDEDQLEMFTLMAGAMMEKGKAHEEDELTDEQKAAKAAADEEAANAAAASATTANRLTTAEIDKLVANRVQDALRRNRAMDALTANEACPFSNDELHGLPTAHLEKLEKSMRTNDYSGQGGGKMIANYTDEEAYTPPKVVLAPRKKAAA